MIVEDDPALNRLKQAYDTLHSALAAVEPETDRLVARDAVRDALDRGLATAHWGQTPIFADTFSLETRLHEGAAFTVLKLRHRDLGTFHTLKTLRDDQRSDPQLRAILLAEGRRMLGLHHPALRAANAVLRLSDGRPGILMDFIDCITLADHLAIMPLRPSAVVQLALRLLDALDALHRHQILHLDLTPTNILLPAGRVEDAIVTDFGLSLSFGDKHADDHLAYALSPAFGAPEQSNPAAVLDLRADLFSLGRVIEACVHSVPQEPLRSWLAWLTAREPDSRPSKSSDARQALLGTLPVTSSQTTNDCGSMATLNI